MSTLVYRFDDGEAFFLLESETTARGPAAVRVEGRGNEAFLRVTLERQPDEPGEVAVGIALPLVAIDGSPEQLLLDVVGDASGCRLFLEVADARGWGLAYSFGEVKFFGRRTCAVRVQEPSECWGAPAADDRRPLTNDRSGSEQVVGSAHSHLSRVRVIPPIQPYHLKLVLHESCRSVDLGFGALSVTGDVRLAPPGIASGGNR